MKALTHYLMLILFFISLLTGQLGCAHTSQRPSEEMTVLSAERPEFTPPANKGQGLHSTKRVAKGLIVGTAKGALVGAGVGALAGACVAAGTGGIGIIAVPYLVAGGAAIGGAVSGLSEGIGQAVVSLPSPEDNESTYNKWKGIRFVRVDSLQPILQWKSFPTAKDLKTNKTGELSRVSEVTYELKILRAQDSFEGDVVYTRIGLSDCSHKVDRRLIPLTRYFWTVRVRFKLDDDYRETKWIHGPPFHTTM